MKTTIFSKTTIGALAACSLLLSACRGDGGFDYDHSALYVSGTDENPVVKFVVEDTPASYAVTVQSTEKVASDVKLLMAIDRSKVAEYNEANKTNYFAIPEGAVELENPEVVISEGNAISSAATVRVLSTEQFEEGCTYMVPVTIKGISGSMMNIIEGSRTIFLRISRVLNFAAVNADYNASSNFIFENAKLTEPKKEKKAPAKKAAKKTEEGKEEAPAEEAEKPKKTAKKTTKKATENTEE